MRWPFVLRSTAERLAGERLAHKCRADRYATAASHVIWRLRTQRRTPDVDAALNLLREITMSDASVNAYIRRSMRAEGYDPFLDTNNGASHDQP